MLNLPRIVPEASLPPYKLCSSNKVYNEISQWLATAHYPCGQPVKNLHLLLLCLLLSGCNSEQPIDRPNILWITVEDMSPHLGSWGNTLVSTPRLDHLAEQGTRYTHLFATAPVCSAARTALITGMYQTSIGGHQHRANQDASSFPGLEHPKYAAVPPPDVKAFTEYLRGAGYFTSNNRKTDYNFGRPRSAWDESNNQAHWRNRESADQPFFSVFNSNLTHESGLHEDREAVIDPSKVELPPYFPDTPVIRKDYAQMLDNVGRMDVWVGGILDELEADGLSDNTIVFFFSDHGDGIPRAKRWLQDSGLLTPMIIRFPEGWNEPDVDSRLISFIDLSATVLSLAGVDIPEYFEGRAFLGEQASTVEREYIFAARDRMDEAHDRSRAVRDGQYKYIRHYHPERPFFTPNAYRDRMPLMQDLIRLNDGGELTGAAAAMFADSKPPEELFDTLDDPHEINNLATDPAYADVLLRLSEELDLWEERTGDMGAIPEEELSEMMWPGGSQPITEMPIVRRLENEDLELSSPTKGASIEYSTDGGVRWQLYSTPVSGIHSDVRAIAVRYGFAQSDTMFVN